MYILATQQRVCLYLRWCSAKTRTHGETTHFFDQGGWHLYLDSLTLLVSTASMYLGEQLLARQVKTRAMAITVGIHSMAITTTVMVKTTMFTCATNMQPANDILIYA